MTDRLNPMTIHPQPKPEKADRKRGERVDYTALTLAKNPPVRDGDYRRWVAEGGACMLLNLEVRCGTKPDRKPIECCHLPYSGEKGTGFKVSDAACVRLCPVHHDLLDGYTLSYQVIAFLWAKALFLREKYWQMTTRGAA